MTAKYPKQLQDTLIARNCAQAGMDKSPMQGKKKMNKSKQAVGFSIKHEDNQVAVTYCLLRPQNAELEQGPLELGEAITVFSQK